MKKKTILISIICIIVGSLIFAFAYDAILSFVEKCEHPREYAESVQKYAAEFAVPEDIIYAVIKTESGFDKDAVSRANCVGLMQLEPKTFRWISDDMLGEKLPDSHIHNTDTNIKYGTWYLSYLCGRFYDPSLDNWETVYAAYNAGPGNVASWLKNPEYSDDGKTLKKIPFAETSNYVKRVAKAREIYIKLYY